MVKIKALPTVALLCLFSTQVGCNQANETKPDEITNKTPNKTMAWSRDDISGWRYELVSEKKVETFRFSDDGHVAATLGERDGSLIAPMFYWRLDKEGQLVVSRDENGPGFTTWKLIAMDEQSAKVEHLPSGVIEEYERSKKP